MVRVGNSSQEKAATLPAWSLTSYDSPQALLFCPHLCPSFWLIWRKQWELGCAVIHVRVMVSHSRLYAPIQPARFRIAVGLSFIGVLPAGPSQ